MMMRPSDPDIVSLAKTSVSFSMVRHPFERIVSAYEDKVAFSYAFNHSVWFLVQILNWNGLDNVWKSVRTICTTQFGDTSFNSFVKMLIANNHQVEDIQDSTLDINVSFTGTWRQVLPQPFKRPRLLYECALGPVNKQVSITFLAP